MGMLRVQKTPHELERESLLRKHFASHNRKLRNMVSTGTNPEYLLKTIEGWKMTEADLEADVRSYIEHLLPKDEAPAQAEPAKSEKKKADKKSDAKASDDSAAE